MVRLEFMARETSSPPYLGVGLVGCLVSWFGFREGRREVGCSPITSVVSVAVDEGDFDAVVEKVGEVV